MALPGRKGGPFWEKKGAAQHFRWVYARIPYCSIPRLLVACTANDYTISKSL